MKITVTFERSEIERITCEFDVGEPADPITVDSMNFWANYGFSSASPLSQHERFPEWKREIEKTRWRVVASDPALAVPSVPRKRRRKGTA